MTRAAAAVAAVMVLAGCGGDGGAAVPSAPASTAASTAAAPRVVFFAEGTGTKSAAVTMRTESGGTIQKDVALPMVNETTGVEGIESTAFHRGGDLYLSLQNSEAAGSVTCRIEVDGVEVERATSTGAYKVATCVAKVP